MKSREHVYCAFCKNPRSLPGKKSLGFANYFQAFGMAALATYLIWKEMNPKGLVIAVMFMIVMEGAILLRRRAHMTCPHCGFDPAIYRRNPELACEQVKKFIEGRQHDPDVWLARKPPITVSRRKKKNSTREIVI